MTTLQDRDQTALLVIDVQNGVMAGTPRRDDVIANINALIGKARAQSVPVIWVQHSDDGNLLQGSENWQYVPELARDAHTTEDLSAWGAPPPEQVIAHTNLYWTNQFAPGRQAGTVDTADVSFGTPAAAVP